MSLTYVVDRLEGEIAVIEGLGDVPLALLPDGLREGDVVAIDKADGEVRLRLDPGARAGAEAETKRLQGALPTLTIPEDGPLEL